MATQNSGRTRNQVEAEFYANASKLAAREALAAKMAGDASGFAYWYEHARADFGTARKFGWGANPELTAISAGNLKALAEI